MSFTRLYITWSALQNRLQLRHLTGQSRLYFCQHDDLFFDRRQRLLVRCHLDTFAAVQQSFDFGDLTPQLNVQVAEFLHALFQIALVAVTSTKQQSHWWTYFSFNSMNCLMDARASLTCRFAL
jgi:hypothetical protein